MQESSKQSSAGNISSGGLGGQGASSGVTGGRRVVTNVSSAT